MAGLALRWSCTKPFSTRDPAATDKHCRYCHGESTTRRPKEEKEEGRSSQGGADQWSSRSSCAKTRTDATVHVNSTAYCNSG